MNDRPKQLRPDRRQLILGLIMGVSLAIVLGVALESWVGALIGLVAGFAIYASVPLFTR